MTDKEDTTPIKLPRCLKCGKISLHCKCAENELKK